MEGLQKGIVAFHTFECSNWAKIKIKYNISTDVLVPWSYGLRFTDLNFYYEMLHWFNPL
jgi:hypothetical protein